MYTHIHTHTHRSMLVSALESDGWKLEEDADVELTVRHKVSHHHT